MAEIGDFQGHCETTIKPEHIHSLIAAAPEMYAALETAGEALSVALERLGVCGEGDGKDHRSDAEFPGGLHALKLIRAALAKAKAHQ